MHVNAGRGGREGRSQATIDGFDHVGADAIGPLAGSFLCAATPKRMGIMRFSENWKNEGGEL